MNELERLERRIVRCTTCPRLVAWREEIAQSKTKRFMEWEYWGRPVPAFGRAGARLLIVGLAPAAHGANRTGRMFTGDRSGEWLYRTLHKFGIASSPLSRERNDGLRLVDCFITAVCRCAPPANKPAPHEIANCRPYLLQEFRLQQRARVVVALGKIAFDAVTDAAVQLGWRSRGARPPFRHRSIVPLKPGLTLIGSYHPSQQNTFTGKLTRRMFDDVFRTARTILDTGRDPRSS